MQLASQESREERDAEIDENRLGNGPEADVDHAAFETEERRQHSQEEPRIDAEKQDLEDRVEGDERRDILMVTLRKLVPDDHHGDAALEADESGRESCRERGGQ